MEILQRNERKEKNQITWIHTLLGLKGFGGFRCRLRWADTTGFRSEFPILVHVRCYKEINIEKQWERSKKGELFGLLVCLSSHETRNGLIERHKLARLIVLASYEIGLQKNERKENVRSSTEN